MSCQMNLWGSLNATSSPGSAYGVTPCAEQDGATTGQFGLDLAHASLSARQAQGLGLMTSGTSGHIGTGSLSSANLQSSLENRLRARTASAGSILYRLTWKHRTTPSGRLICALRASAARISVSDFILSGWPTATVTDAHRGEKYDPFAKNQTMNMAAQLSGWPTPKAADGEKNIRTPDGAMSELLRGKLSDVPGFAQLAGWHTPLSRDGDKLDATPPAIEKRMRDGREIGTAMEARMCSTHGWSDHPGPARLCSDGTLLTGSSAGMAAGGRLNPAHSRWLMRLPPEWDDCAPSEMRWTRKPRQASSKP